jgi:hypothetical protein
LSYRCTCAAYLVIVLDLSQRFHEVLRFYGGITLNLDFEGPSLPVFDRKLKRDEQTSRFGKRCAAPLDRALGC